VVAYNAEWKSSVAAVATVAIFLGSNQLQDRAGNVQQVSNTGTNFEALGSCALGVQEGARAINSPVSPVPTGQIVGRGQSEIGGAARIHAAAATRSVSSSRRRRGR
jgi:hypothetical protein